MQVQNARNDHRHYADITDIQQEKQQEQINADLQNHIVFEWSKFCNTPNKQWQVAEETVNVMQQQCNKAE